MFYIKSSAKQSRFVTLWLHLPMALLVELHDLKDLVDRLQYDLGIANDKLQRVTDDNKRLLAVVEDLKTELRVAQTVAAIHTEDQGITHGPTPSASDAVMAPITMQQAAVVEVGETKQHISVHMDVDAGPDSVQ